MTSAATGVSALKRRWDAWLVSLLAAAFGFRLFLVSLPRVMRWDEPSYLLLGRAIWHGHGFRLDGLPELHYPPLFPFLFGASDRVLGNGEWATDFWFLLAGTVLVYVVYRLAAALYDVHVARVAAVLVAFFPGLSSAVLYWGTMTEPLFVCLIYGAFWAGWRAAQSGSLLFYALAGALLSVAYLGRPEGVGWFVTLGFACVALTLLDRRPALRKTFAARRLAGWAVFAVAFLALCSPYLSYLHHHTGRWVLSTKPGITWKIGSAVLHHDPEDYDRIVATLASPGGEPRWFSTRRFDKPGVGIGVPGAKALAHRALLNVERLASGALSQQVFPVYLVPFLLIGWWPFQPRTDWKPMIFLLAATAPVLAFLAFHIQQRFFAPAFPALLIGVALGFHRFGQWARRVTGRGSDVGSARRVAILVAAIAVVLLAVGHVKIIRTKLPELDFAHKRAGLWLRSHAPKNAKVLSLDEAVAAYARRPWVPSPRAPYREYIAYARRKRASYVVVDEFEARKIRPYLAFLLDTSHPPPDLRPVMTTRDQNGETIVFALKRSEASKGAAESRGMNSRSTHSSARSSGGGK